MSLNNVPSKAEVMGWNPQSLADYLKKLKLSGCDKVVMKGCINGVQFLQMAERDFHVFSPLYFPIITKIQREINNGEQRKAFGLKLKPQKSPTQAFVQDKKMFESDEFDSESDNDYESPEQEEDDDRYICALAEAQTVEQQDSEESFDGNYRPLDSAETMKPPRPPRASKLQGSHSRDPAHDPSPAERTSKPPLPRRMNPSPQRPLKTPAPPPPSQPNLHIDRSKKPGQPTPTQRAPPNSKGSTVKALHSSTLKLPKPWTPKPSDRTSKLSLSPPVPTQPTTINYSILRQKQGLDPSWYGGKVTRHQAEAALREMNKDGAFVVRDSSKGSADHPYTLMLLKEGKVYNIKIRNQGGSYSLGNGLNNKNFPGVEEMITHHKHTPLLLIDATDQSSEGHSQSCLLYPAGS